MSRLHRLRELPDFDSMVAVASGPGARVDGWAVALSKAAIACSVAQSCDLSEDYAELWVANDDADEARVVLRNADGASKRLIW